MINNNKILQEWYDNSFLIALLAFGYYVTGIISIELLSDGKIITMGIFAPEGIALAFVLYYGKKVIPGIFLGQFLLAFFHGDMGFAASFSISVINSIEAYLALYLFKKFKVDPSFRVMRDVIGFTLIVSLALQPFSAIVSNTLLAIIVDGYHDFSHNVFSWWFGNIMGQFLFTPFVYLLLKNMKDVNWLNYFFYGTLFGLFCTFFLIFISVNNPFLLLAISLPVSLYILSRKGVLYGTLVSVIVAVVSSFSIYLKTGAFYLQSNIDNTINYNLFVLAHISIILTVGVLLQERKRHEKILEERIADEVSKNKEQQLLMLQQSRLAQMGEMISMIAHQWRQPLNNLALVNQLTITKYNRGKLDDKAMKYFKENSESQIELMSETIDNFRNFFKSDAQKQECVLNDVIKTTLELSAPVFQSSNIEVIYDAPHRYTIIGYANALSQVLLNILNNAKDALIENNIEHKKIWIKLYKDEDDVIFIEIEDNAGGIDEAIIDKIFDPYFSTKLEKNGTGLGLYMSRMIVQEQMKSSLTVKNSKEGAKFEIKLNQKKRGGVKRMNLYSQA